MEHFCANIMKSCHWPRTRCRLKIFYFLALVAILFNGAEPCGHLGFLIDTILACFDPEVILLLKSKFPLKAI